LESTIQSIEIGEGWTAYYSAAVAFQRVTKESVSFPRIVVFWSPGITNGL
jgi:hypothetical protein